MANNNQTAREQSYCFIFVCQKGVLELKSVLLAASLSLRLKCGHELVAAVPQPAEKWGRPSNDTIRLLENMGVRIESIWNTIDKKIAWHAFMNKAYALGISTTKDKLVFLDSDIFCLRDFFHEERFLAPISLKPVDYHHQISFREWETLYQMLGESMPSGRVRATVSGKTIPPYYNTGVIFLDAKLAEPIRRHYLGYYEKILETKALDKHPFYREQVSLTLAVHKMGLSVDLLDEKYNCPFVRTLNESSLPYFFHYHKLDAFLERPPLLQSLRHTLKAHPAVGSFAKGWLDTFLSSSPGLNV